VYLKHHPIKRVRSSAILLGTENTVFLEEIKMGLTNFPNGITSFGIPIYGDSVRDTSGTTFFVDGNSGSDQNKGLSWDDALKTIARACALSTLDIARGADRWARRNTIFIAGDRFVESLTVGAEKTDIIGVGSCDNKPMAVIKGVHVFDTTVYQGMRFINVGFENSAAGIMVDIPNEQIGMEFIGCVFDGRAVATATTGIRAAGVDYLKIKGCKFTGLFTTAAISLLAGEFRGIEIVDNYIESGAIGLSVASSVTCATQQGLVARNYFDTVTQVVADASDKFMYVGNRGITDAVNSAALTHGIAATQAIDNEFSTSSGGAISVPPVNYGAQA